MADLSTITQPTIQAVYDQWAKRKNENNGHRRHLGASVLGNECDRSGWYVFRWCTDKHHDGRLLRLFERGHLEEFRFVEELKWAGVEIHEVDDRTGKQFMFSDVGGHVGGSMDSVGIGFLERPDVWHVVEYKTHSEKSFKELQKKGVEESKPVHYAQMQLYMHWSGLKRAYYMAVNKNNDELFGERVRYDEKLAANLIKKAWDIVQSPKPLIKMTEDPTFFKCSWCDHKAICHERALPAVNCRTCLHATPVTDGTEGVWVCERKNIELTTNAQHAACDGHRFIPDLVSWATPVDASERDNWVEYEFNGHRFRNGGKGKDSFPSKELREVVPEMLGDEFAETLRNELDAFYADNQINILKTSV